MSFPNIPNVTPSINLTRTEVVNLLLASIAFEELGLAHLTNAEAEKLQAVLGTLPGISVTASSISQLLSVNQSVNKTLRSTIKKQMLLEFKLEDLLEIPTHSSTTSNTTSSSTTTTTSSSSTTTSSSSSTTTTSSSSTTTSSSSSTTTTSSSSTTSTTTSPILIFEDIASAQSTIPDTSDTDVAFYNSTAAPVITNYNISAPTTTPGSQGIVDLGNLTKYLFFFADGSTDANWQGATKGFIGDVAVDGIQASERTSGDVPYAGTIYTNDVTLGAWQAIVNQNTAPNVPVTQAFESLNQLARISDLESNLISALQQINALTATTGFTSVASTDLDGLNTQNGINEVFVINVTSGFTISSQINITGDPGDVYILRWDEGGFDPTNGYQGIVKFQSGGAIVPHGGLKASNFINVAGDINSSGGGSTPAPPYPQGPRYLDGQGPLIENGSDFSGGGFFTGYWLTTGSPDTELDNTGIFIGPTQPLSNGIFVGGWYTLTTKFSMTSGTSGVYVSPPPALQPNPAIDIVKEVSVDGGITWFDANTPPGPPLTAGDKPWFRITVTNTGNETLTNITVTDDHIGLIGTIPTLDPGASYQWVIQAV